MSPIRMTLFCALLAGCEAHTPIPPPTMALGHGRRVEHWSQAHSDWLAMHCEFAESGGNQMNVLSWPPPLGNVVMVVGSDRYGWPLFVAYDCTDSPPWPERQF